MRAAIYLRQSKDTEKTGLAVDRQEEDCRKLAKERGWTVVEPPLIDNDMSASSGRRRPAYEELLALVDAKAVDVVIAWHIDRLTRNLGELENIISRCEAAGVRVATVSGDLDLSTDAGRLVGRILGVVARGEIERKSARQKRAARQNAEAGNPPKRRAFGFTKDNQHDPVEAPALVELYELILGGMALKQAPPWLNARGHTTTTGKPWERSGVRAMLLNARNAGLRVFEGEVIRAGTWAPIVSEEVWRATVELLTDPARKPSPGTGRKWLGTSLFKCHCGASVRSTYSHAGTRIYQCRRAAHMNRSADRVDQLVSAAMADILRRPEMVAAHLSPTVDTTELRQEASKLRRRLQEIENDYAEADGAMSFAMFQRVSGKVTERLDVVNGRLADAGSGSALAMMLTAPDPGQKWLDADLGTQKAVIAGAADVTLLKSTRKRGAFDDSIDVTPKRAGAHC